MGRVILMYSQKVVTPAKAGVQRNHKQLKLLNSGFRRNGAGLQHASFPRRRESSLFNLFWIPACAGVTVFAGFARASILC